MNELYYLTNGAGQMGPYTFAQLQSMWRSGAITARMLYCREGVDEWLPVTSMAELLDPTTAPVPRLARPVAPPARAADESERRVYLLFILCFFFGLLGAHAFYAGRAEQGLLFLGCSMVAVVFGVLGGGATLLSVLAFIAVSIFTMVDFIRIVSGNYKDGEGRKITQWT